MQKTTLLFDEKEMKEASIFDGVSWASSAAMHSRRRCAGARALWERRGIWCGVVHEEKKEKDVWESKYGGHEAPVYSG